MGDGVVGFVFRAVAVLVAIIVHEYAHGWMADAQGDPTPRASGRLTLNPLAHLDPVGTLMLLVFRFGWAKPVPVNPSYFRDRRGGMLRVALAGPGANLLTALAAMAAWKAGGGLLGAFGAELLQWILLYNVWFALFNLLPVPPLDGSRVLRPFLRGQAARWFWEYEQYGWVAMVLLVATGVVSALLGPVADLVIRIMDRLTFFIG